MRDGAEGSNVDERVNPYAPTNFKQSKEKLSEIKQGDVQRQNEEFSTSLYFYHTLEICEIYARGLYKIYSYKNTSLDILISANLF